MWHFTSLYNPILQLNNTLMRTIDFTSKSAVWCFLHDMAKKIKKWAWCGLGAGLVKAWCRLGAGLIWQILYPKKLAHPVWFHGSCCWLFGVSHISSYRSCSWTTVGLLYVPTTMLSVLFSLLVYCCTIVCNISGNFGKKGFLFKVAIALKR